MKPAILDPIVKRIAQDRTCKTIDASVQEIAEAVEAVTGQLLSKSVIHAALKRVGAVSESNRWRWQHNKARHE